MCGIYGAFSTDGERPIHADVLERMAHVLAHCGPDGGGSHLAGPFGMGMRRLSIIDLTSGDQPMCNEDGTLCGLLVPPNNAPALAGAILSLLETPAIATEMGVQGRARALAEFGMDRMHERIGSFYCRALGTVHGAPTPREAMQRP